LFKFDVAAPVVLGLKLVPSNVNFPDIPGMTLALLPPALTSKLATREQNKTPSANEALTNVPIKKMEEDIQKEEKRRDSKNISIYMFGFCLKSIAFREDSTIGMHYNKVLQQ
tara:strand:- start:1864 stop:2199 length:336 start_codon:yes stop_codon:yes gene_type:complete